MKITLRYFPVALSVFLVFFVGTTGSVAQEIQTPRPGMADVLESVTPAVVNISVTGQAAMPTNPLLNDPFFQRFFDLPDQPQTRPVQSAGSGVIIDAEQGYVLTNHHVVNNAEEIQITLQDKRRLPARLIGSDAATDIALLQIEADGLTAVRMSDSDTLRVGDFVAAIGNPFGLGQTVTTGIVSALSRAGLNSDNYEDFIQTDASINPGNSGGALVDYNGELVGINTAIISPAGGNVGIGFAVPINMAHTVIDQLLEFGDIRRGLLGVRISDLEPDVAELLEIDQAGGAVVSSVEPGSPAEAAGIEAGDVIVSVDGESIGSAGDLRNTIGLTRAGTEVAVGLVREDGHKTLDVVIGDAPRMAGSGKAASASSVLEGAQLSDIPRGHELYGQLDGVLVSEVAQGSRAYRNGLEAGDVITAVNRQPVSSRAGLLDRLAESGGVVALNVRRGNQVLFLIMR